MKVETTKEDEDKTSDDEFGEKFEEIKEIQRIKGERKRAPSRSPERRKKNFQRIVVCRH